MAASSSNEGQLKNRTGGQSDDLTANKKVKDPSISTMVLNFENGFDPFKASSTPLYLTASFKQKSPTNVEGDNSYIYTRIGNPTRDALESLLRDLEKAERAFCFTSGMAALSAVSHLLKPGNEILAGVEIYGGSTQLLNKIIPNRGIRVNRVDTTNLAKVQRNLCDMKTRKKENRKTLCGWRVQPTLNRKYQILKPSFSLLDCFHEKVLPQIERFIGSLDGHLVSIEEIARMAHEQEALLLVDNSMMSPVLSQPLTLGADIVMHSATKFIAGHSDVVAGVLAVKDERLAKDFLALQRMEGSGLAPFDCWLCLRGIQTMALRVEKQQANAQKIAEFLKEKKNNNRGVTKVYYVGLHNHPGHDLHKTQATGAGSVLSFLTGSPKLSSYIVTRTKYFSLAVSFGGVKSYISIPYHMSHESLSTDQVKASGLAEDLIRISVGIEDVKDLIADLDKAIEDAIEHFSPDPMNLIRFNLFTDK